MKRPKQLIIEAADSGKDSTAGYTQRYSVIIDGKRIWLQQSIFRYMAMLAWARVNLAHTDYDGWIHREGIDPYDPNAVRYLHRLKTAVALDIETSWPVFETNRQGMYRLDVAPSNITFNTKNILAIPDHRLAEMFESMVGTDVVNCRCTMSGNNR